jgi:putative ABC transport system permease protein
MISRVLPRKLRRDMWRQRWQFLATALVIGIGVAVYVGASDAYLNLRDSFDRAYATQRLPDAVISGRGVHRLVDEAHELPGDPAVDARRVGDVALRIGGHTLLGRAVVVPAGAQPPVSRLAVRSGELPGPGEVLAEEHLADHYGLAPGATVDVLTGDGWRPMRVSGSALSTEYFWPARSMQEIMTTPEQFGVVFVVDSEIRQFSDDPVDQLAIFATDRGRAPALVAAAAALAEDDGLVFTGRDEQPSYRALTEDVDAVGEFARLLPWVFLTAAVLGTYVLLSRLVSAQRSVIGTLSANGLSGRTIRTHYLGYGVAAGLLGAVPGLVGGYLIGGWFTTSYTAALSLPLRVTSVHPQNLLVGAGVGVVAAALAAWLPARAAARISPAEAMRITPADVRGSRTLLERLLPPVGRLPARWRMTLRGVTRNRRRTLLTVLGVAVSVSLVMVFAGMRDTVTTVIHRQYNAIQLEDAQVHVTPDATATVLRQVRDDPAVAVAEPFVRYDVTLSGPGGDVQTLLTGLPPDTRMHDFTGLDGEDLQLPEEGLLLGLGARAALGVGVGDRVQVSVVQTGERWERVVTGFVDEPMNPVAYASLDDLQQVTSSPSSGGVLLTWNGGADAASAAHRIAAMPGVAAYLSTSTVERAMTDAFALYDTLVGLMLLFAALMAAALLYNAMSANVAERSVELGTLQAAGMSSRLLGRLVATENLILVVVGLPVGLVLGTWLADWFMSTYETQGYPWSLEMSAGTPLIVAAGVLMAAVLVQLPSLRSVRRMDLARIVRERSL